MPLDVAGRNHGPIAGAPIEDPIGKLIADRMTPAAVELTLEIRKEIARHAETDGLRRRAVERAQIDADLAQRRFMLVDPNNRLVADTLEREWNDKLRALAKAQEEREREGGTKIRSLSTTRSATGSSP